jgi:hypothetical protein
MLATTTAITVMKRNCSEGMARTIGKRNQSIGSVLKSQWQFVAGIRRQQSAEPDLLWRQQ